MWNSGERECGSRKNGGEEQVEEEYKIQASHGPYTLGFRLYALGFGLQALGCRLWALGFCFID